MTQLASWRLARLRTLPRRGPAGPGSVSNVSAVDAGAACSAQSNLTFVENSTAYGFSGAETTGSSCSTLPFASGSSFPVTITFTPSASEAGPYNTTMTATNAADGDTGTFPVSGVAAIAQTITVTSPSAATTKVACGVPPVSLAATATSGLPVVFTTTTPTVCTGLNTGTVTFINNGTCTIDANQAGNSRYAPAPQKVVTFTVSAVTQRLTNLTPASTPYTTTPIPLWQASSNMTAGAAPVCFALDLRSRHCQRCRRGHRSSMFSAPGFDDYRHRYDPYVREPGRKRLLRGGHSDPSSRGQIGPSKHRLHRAIRHVGNRSCNHRLRRFADFGCDRRRFGQSGHLHH